MYKHFHLHLYQHLHFHLHLYMFLRLYLHLQFSFQELVVKRVKTALARNAGRASTAPTDHVVKLWQSNYNSFKVYIDRALSDNNNGVDDNIIFRVFNWEEYKDQPAVTEAAEAALSWARGAKKNLQFSRGDYLYALNLLLYFLGAMVPLKIFTPAEVYRKIKYPQTQSLYLNFVCLNFVC